MLVMLFAVVHSILSCVMSTVLINEYNNNSSVSPIVVYLTVPICDADYLRASYAGSSSDIVFGGGCQFVKVCA